MAKYTFDAMGKMADWLGWFNKNGVAKTPPTGSDATPTTPSPATPPPAAAPAAAPATPPPPKTPDAKPVKDDRGFLQKALDWIMGNEIDPKTGKLKVNPIDGDAIRQQKPKKPVAPPAPERVNPGDTTWNQKNTPRLYAGLTTSATAGVRQFYSTFCDNLVEVSSPEVAEAAKLFENTFRQVNIALVNEFAQIDRDLQSVFGDSFSHGSEVQS